MSKWWERELHRLGRQIGEKVGNALVDVASSSVGPPRRTRPAGPPRLTPWDIRIINAAKFGSQAKFDVYIAAAKQGELAYLERWGESVAERLERQDPVARAAFQRVLAAALQRSAWDLLIPLNRHLDDGSRFRRELQRAAADIGAALTNLNQPEERVSGESWTLSPAYIWLALAAVVLIAAGIRRAHESRTAHRSTTSSQIQPMGRSAPVVAAPSSCESLADHAARLGRGIYPESELKEVRAAALELCAGGYFTGREKVCIQNARTYEDLGECRSILDPRE